MSAQATHSPLAISHPLCLQLIAVLAHFNFASSSRQKKKTTHAHTLAHRDARFALAYATVENRRHQPPFVTSLLAALRSLSVSYSPVLPLSHTVVAKVVNLMSVAFKLKRALSVRCWSEGEREGDIMACCVSSASV